MSESLNRSAIAGLISHDKKRLMKLSILDFLLHGLRYVYPQKPGSRVRGVPTAHAAPPLASEIASSEPHVWPYGEGKARGESIEPLHLKVPEACLKDHLFEDSIKQEAIYGNLFHEEQDYRFNKIIDKLKQVCFAVCELKGS